MSVAWKFSYPTWVDLNFETFDSNVHSSDTAIVQWKYGRNLDRPAQSRRYCAAYPTSST
jgi:hypothetical protein